VRNAPINCTPAYYKKTPYRTRHKTGMAPVQPAEISMQLYPASIIPENRDFQDQLS